MIRILIDGDPPQIGQLEDWLTAWGMLALPLPRGAGHPAAQPRTVTDAVVVFWGDSLLDPGATPPVQADAVAPLLLVGGDRAPAALRNAASALVSAPGGRGERLQEALRYCLEREHQPLTTVAPPPARAGYQAYLQFFNHELRTPLTAANVALEAASRALEQCPSCTPTLELLDRALRNLQRLQRTVDWAGDFVQGAVTGPPENPLSLLADLIADLDALEAPVPLTWDADLPGDLGAEVDRSQWRRLLRQVTQAVHYFRPAAATHISLAVAPEAARLSVQVSVTGDASSRRVNRTGLTDPLDAADELRRLIAFTVSPGLLDAMRAAVTIEASPYPKITLYLPLVLQAACV